MYCKNCGAQIKTGAKFCSDLVGVPVHPPRSVTYRAEAELSREV